MFVCYLCGGNQWRVWLKTLENGSSEISNGAKSWKTQSSIEEVEHQTRITGRELRTATQREGRGEKHMNSKSLVLGSLFGEVGSEASHLLRETIKGTHGKQSDNKSKIHQSILRAQLRLSALNLSCSGAQKEGAKHRLMQNMEDG